MEAFSNYRIPGSIRMTNPFGSKSRLRMIYFGITFSKDSLFTLINLWDKLTALIVPESIKRYIVLEEHPIRIATSFTVRKSLDFAVSRLVI